MDDRRTNARVPVLVAGELRLRNGLAFPCRVRDLSRGGALIVFPQADKLPKRFFLRIGSAEPREIVVAWRGADEVGVQFVETSMDRRTALRSPKAEPASAGRARTP